MKYGFIGLGNMANAIISGILRNKLAEPSEIIASSRTQATRESVAKQTGITVTESNREAAEGADMLILAVPSESLNDVLAEIRPAVTSSKIVVSVVPSGSLEWLDKHLSTCGSMGFGPEKEADRGTDKLKLVRALPNAPALVGAGMTAYCVNENVTKEDRKEVLVLLKSFGEAQEIAENLFDMIGTITGTPPAAVFMLIEAIADAAASGGLARDAAYIFAAQTVMGSASMVLSTGLHPGQLRDMVCTPESGITEAVRILESRGFRSAVTESVKAVEQFRKVTGAGMR